MEHEETTHLAAEVGRLREQQQKFLTFAAAQFAEVFAMLETVLDLEKMLLTQKVGDFPEVAAKIGEMLDAHRARHAQLVRDRLGFVDFLGDTPPGPSV